jgi:hypothetical protein
MGWSWGIPGFRYGISPNGQRYISVGIPGTGLYWIKYLGKRRDRDDGQLPAKQPRVEPDNAAADPWWKDQIQ